MPEPKGYTIDLNEMQHGVGLAITLDSGRVIDIIFDQEDGEVRVYPYGAEDFNNQEVIKL